MSDFVSMRRAMVDSQLRTNRVTDERILEAMETVPRELFVPENRRELACIDEDIPLGHGRYLLEPMVFARLAQAADIGPEDVVLDVACATGYSSAILGRLGQAIVAVETVPEMVAAASENVSAVGVDNVVVENRPLTEGWPDQAPYDVIVVNGAVEHIPDALTAQLADGGRLVTVFRRGAGPGTAELLIRAHGVVSRRALFDANTPKLEEFLLEKGFVF